MKKMEAADKLALSVQEAADLLGISKPLMYTLVRRDDFPAFKIGQRTVVNKRLLQVWLDRQAGGNETEADTWTG